MEDFEDVVVIGEERPQTIGDIDLPTQIKIYDEDGFLIEEALPDESVIAPVVSTTFADALLAYNSGDVGKALTLAKIVGAEGDAEAQVLVGHILMRGKSGYIDDKDAVRWLKLAADQSDTDALLALGEMAVDSRGGLSPSDAVGFFERASSLGNTQAMRAMSTLAEDGIGVMSNPVTAVAWESKAAKSGDTEAMRRRGAALIESDPKAALGWFEKAAEKGDAEAAYAAAIMYVDNFEIMPNEARAAVLMAQAANGGIAAAMADYGLLLYQGAGVPRDIPASAVWFRKASEAGDKEGQFLYAFTLAKGEGVDQDYEEAYYWLLKSGGDSGVDDYDASRRELRERLEANVDGAILDRARSRIK